MDTNKLKRFATEARNILLSGVVQRLAALGFQSDGTATEKPELLGGGAVFMGEVQSEDFYHKWMSLYHRMQSHSFREVAEEAAYTWFNRLVAIRIMVKNELIPAVLEYESDEVRIPVIVTEARQGRMPQMDEADRQKLDALLLDDALTDEQFALLIVAYCHSNPIISKCFGKIADYTELLLPSNILKNDGFIDRLNADDYISDDDYRSPELIGWLYQFYISERKDEVFAKKGKFEADEIPAATQIFTPNWIVKYMVQNTVGRIYLDNNPYSDIKEGMKYLVESDEPTPTDAIYRFDDIHDLRVADLACGSGHILNECFDLLYQIYIEEGYNRRRAVEDIFRYNLTGVDIDTRAKQLAMFALLLKACQKDRSFADGHVLPRVWDMPKTGLPLPADTRLANEIEAVNKTLADADTLGSIMKFSLSPAAREWVVSLGEENETAQLVLALTDKYVVLVMNPPYMGGGNMNAVLSNYVKKNYPEGKADLATVFVERMPQLLQKNGRYSFIIPPSWMFLSTFEGLRKQIIEHQTIDSLLHLSRGVFGADFGASSAVIVNAESKEAYGTYFRLIERTFQEFDQKHLRMLFEQTLADHDFKYNFKEYTKDVISLPYSEEGNRIYYPHVSQQNFEKIPGCPIGYWVSEKLVNAFNHSSIDSVCKPSKGMMPGSEYLRNVWEIAFSNITFDVKSHQESKTKKEKWYPYFKGGSFRRWFGNREFVVDYQYDGYRVKEGDRNPSLYFKDNINWSKISSGLFSARTGLIGGLYDDAACQCYVYSHENYDYILGLLNSKVAQTVLWTISQTFNYISSEVAKIPYIKHDEERITELTQQNIAISRADWDAHETSWDFQENELVRLSKEAGESSHRLSDLMDAYREHWTEQFLQLHANEEELNRQFIEIYGLEDELTPDVSPEEITILQQGEISIENGQIVWHDDVIVKQLISYAVGCMMGRYSLDHKGLILANQGDGQKEYEALVPNSRFAIDDDGIIPLMSVNSELTDHISLRFKTWLSIAFGEENFMDNLNFVEHALDKRLEDYFLKDFWKDHKKMYQNRPIYWLFSSKKGAFQCIAYMHRMNAYTAEKVRTQYLLPHIEWLMTRQAEMQANAANLSARERKELDNIGKQIDECREYHDRLHVIADRQIAFDLDDGVLVNYAKFGDVLAKLK
ncbi:BREX-1 system adenine-specific DNA-methyltransferase PglX [Bacteroides xylanisolvens]|uniref:BREX-1 system adenine-specific DNA-methyltransferase PglX n=1 Tax=Bacteroides xylanisolvens TaxID=371601 RepID=UPI00230798EB|nr:BREX-1 system adenine-specific DNA-methyltransferase PglX [Bacteroides xylanisolvens]MDB0716074.1 BREX-1 system adenine-specific DNA-methyltransferase PglX [Bacteroides xylanisolvens]MDB0736131.1 BREX-1 system adenine-specific DNA-methyltransferase PglX [Bacteroides xylanisolvens]